MKQRVISACVGLCVLLVAVICYNTYLVNILLALLSMLGIYELLGAMKLRSVKPLAVVCMLPAVFIPLVPNEWIYRYMASFMLGYVFLLFCMQLIYHDTLRFEQTGFLFFAVICLPFSLSLIPQMREMYGPVVSLFYTLLALGSAWLSDTGAYFVGCRFGKHKLAPAVSPKKTVEGFIGGIVTCVVSYLLIAVIYSYICRRFFTPIEIDYLRLMLVAPFASVISVVGDLSASVIKRQSGIKDFGKIMPGHGGMLDRFDSALFTIPCLYIVSLYLPLV